MTTDDPVTYDGIAKKISKVSKDIRMYRVNAVLLRLIDAKQKAARLKRLEEQLTLELSKKLQAPLNIDAILDELESCLN